MQYFGVSITWLPTGANLIVAGDRFDTKIVGQLDVLQVILIQSVVYDIFCNVLFKY